MLYDIEGYNDEKLIAAERTASWDEARAIVGEMCYDELECVILLSVYEKGDMYKGVQLPVGQRNLIHVWHN